MEFFSSLTKMNDKYNLLEKIALLTLCGSLDCRFRNIRPQKKSINSSKRWWAHSSTSYFRLLYIFGIGFKMMVIYVKVYVSLFTNEFITLWSNDDRKLAFFFFVSFAASATANDRLMAQGSRTQVNAINIRIVSCVCYFIFLLCDVIALLRFNECTQLENA